MRFIVECIWSGYTASQARPCYRRIIRKGEAYWYRGITAIQFTDNTTMSVKVRACLPREKVQEIRGYDSLFESIFREKLSGFVRVADLHEDHK